MIGKGVSWLYLKRVPAEGEFARLKVALVADELTHECLSHDARVYAVTPLNHRLLFKSVKPDLLLVESAWKGFLNRWKYRVASYRGRGNETLAAVVAEARGLGIPCVFWNREDGIHFDRFIDSARLFDTVFTVDETCVPRYRAALKPGAFVAPLMFAAQPAIHGFKGIGERRRRACFLGSYSRHIHDTRRARQDMLLGAAARTIGLTIHDRNSSRGAAHYRYPEFPGVEIAPRIAHALTGGVYRSYIVSLNVNTVEDSPTMFSRRLIEIVGSGGLALTTPALSVDRYFGDYCLIAASDEEASEHCARLKGGLSRRDEETIRAGAEYIAREHSYRERLRTILAAAGRG